MRGAEANKTTAFVDRNTANDVDASLSRAIDGELVALARWKERVTRGGWRLTSGVMALLTGPHQISFSEPGSFTIRLSSGDRPVFAPEYADSAPVEVMAEPVS